MEDDQNVHDSEIILIKQISHNGLYLFRRLKAGSKAYNLRREH